ncbi:MULTISPECIES: hypothetical protein [Streptomyces]|uniref:Aromatic ring-opening dioxygenase LigA n=1 Tax=Streptomyces fradiae ATCC 10745 = DSM 40063 TaxID=1319510 RepID=A0A1Y2NT19_STRFR|nr:MULTISPECIES: hypothetical protein [Streptomyces]KAF0650754.1 hypothetical protein K701_07085 [Streptomyces fradiae ATCC 10745 = DSM 40063]OSY50098.1 hypothetical protein BG846_04273 [Streptomyces fradiae ATCC 10745 = DSM 40063]QEV13470.1 hypothetical protein CP974_17410 [Streptomyces fradiae ATCC 10745 = DSM 40063]
MGALKRHAGKAAVAVLALVLVAAGVIGWGGFYERWQTRRLVERACDGVLPVDQVLALLGEGDLTRGRLDDKDGGDRVGALDDPKTGLRVQCTVLREVERNAGKPVRDGSVTVTVSGVPTPNREDRREGLYPGTRSDLPPAPLGQGWNGVVSTGADRAYTAVLLDCRGRASDLLVTAAVEVEDRSLDNPRHRLAFSRIATATATEAARRYACDTPLGRPLTTAPPLSVSKDEYVAPAQARGTCAGVPARDQRVARAWEATGGPAPLEECHLGDSEGHPSYVLEAGYGPYAEEAKYWAFERRGEKAPGARAGELLTAGYWTSTTCDGGQQAFFTVVPAGGGAYRPAEQPADDVAYERAALKAFAERSAKAHGCPAPPAPPASGEAEQ